MGAAQQPPATVSTTGITIREAGSRSGTGNNEAAQGNKNPTIHLSEMRWKKIQIMAHKSNNRVYVSGQGSMINLAKMLMLMTASIDQTYIWLI